MKRLLLLSTLAFATLALNISPADARPRHQRTHFATDVQYLPHPAGCPRTRFCGCGAYYDLTGKVVTRGTYAKASYWRHHYKGPTPVAVWPGHVAIIEQMLGNGTALMRDYNSGGHKSRRHVRSLAGARIVGGGHYASAFH